MTRESWKEAGSKSVRKRAKERALKLIENPSIKPIDESLQKRLDKIASTRLN